MRVLRGIGLSLTAWMLAALILAGLTVVAALQVPPAPLRSASPPRPGEARASSAPLGARLRADAARTARAAIGLGSASAAVQSPRAPSPRLALQPMAADGVTAGPSAALDFRIVIPTTLGMASQTRREGRAVQTVSVATERLPDRVRRTVSSP